MMTHRANEYVDDLNSKIGAECIAQFIEAYWLEHGCHVRVWVERRGHVDAMRSATYVVRSNMVNGLPKELVRAVA